MPPPFGRSTMPSQFVEDGQRRLQQSPEFQARLIALRTSIRARYAADLAQAGFWQRCLLDWRIAREFRRESQKLEPALDSLYLDSAAVRI